MTARTRLPSGGRLKAEKLGASQPESQAVIKRRDAEIMALLLPAIGSVFLDPAMAVVDTAIVGRLGTAALGAVGLSNLVSFFCSVFFSFLLVVTTPRVAGAVAGGDRRRASIATAHALWVGLGCGTLLAVAMCLGAPWLVSTAFSADPAVADLAVKHLAVRALAAPAAVLLFVANGAFRGFRDTKYAFRTADATYVIYTIARLFTLSTLQFRIAWTPLIAGIVQNVVNLCLDIFLVGFAGWGVRGAAAAGSVAQYIGALAMIGMLARRSMLDLRDLRSLPSLEETLEMLKPGIPLAFCIGSVMATVVTATNLASGLGTVALAAHTIVKQIIDFCLGLLGTFSTVAQTLTAASLGKGDKKEARQFFIRLLQLAIRFGSVLALIVLLGSRVLPTWFTSDKDVIAMAQGIIPIVGFLLPLAPCGTTLEGVLLGSFKVNWVGGRTVASALIALAILRVSAASGWGLTGVWIGLIMLTVCNCVGDAWRITRQDSPIAAVLDLGLSMDEDGDEPHFLPLSRVEDDK